MKEPAIKMAAMAVSLCLACTGACGFVIKLIRGVCGDSDCVTPAGAGLSAAIIFGFIFWAVFRDGPGGPGPKSPET